MQVGQLNTVMDQVLVQILDACNLAKELEHSLQNADALRDTRLLLDSCEAIVAAFGRPITLLRYQVDYGERRGANMMVELADGAFFGSHAVAADVRTTMAMAELGGAFMGYVSDPGGGAAAKAFTGRRGEVGPAGEGSSSGRRPAVQRPPKKRKDGAAMITMRMPGHTTGDKDTPPYDGYMWRKYGRKGILNSTFRRNYYRCAYKSYCGCRAKKYAQRLDKEPDVFEVIYLGEHTCNTASTPLPMPPTFAIQGGSNMISNHLIVNAQPGLSLTPQHTEPQLPLSRHSWFEREQQPHERNTVQTLFTPLQGGEGSNRDVELLDMDLADAMFNWAKKGNIMDSIFVD